MEGLKAQVGSGNLGEKSIEVAAKFLSDYGFQALEPKEESWKDRDSVRREG